MRQSAPSPLILVGTSVVAVALLLKFCFPTFRLVTIGALAANMVSFSLFGIDKACARMGWSRVSERTLLYSSALGGVVGAWFGRWCFRHKTNIQRKPMFNLVLVAASVLFLSIATTWVWFL
jgi:uncharacterized membrane protein YsdA (DUF1294 family)